jgi:hypothetical protein
MSQAGLRIRVDDTLRQEFIRESDTTAAQVLRAYMRDYVERRCILHRHFRSSEVGRAKSPTASITFRLDVSQANAAAA